MKFTCRLAVVNRRGGVILNFSWGSIKVAIRNMNSSPFQEPFITVRTSPNTKFRAEYNLIGNIEAIFTQFYNHGRVTLCLKEPSYNIIITKVDTDKLIEFIIYLKKLLPKDSPVQASMAFEPPIKLHLHGQEEYVLRMENIIDMNINLGYFTCLKISDCTLEWAGYQVPIASAFKRMKNLKILRLKNIELRSSTFLEIESKELKQLRLCHCDTRLPTASLFKNDLCYKDSLVELHLDENNWSEVPNGIFQFQNLLKLSLSDSFSDSDSCITHLPDKFTNLPKLQELLLSNNQLTHVPPSIFALQNLSDLLLNGNLITELPNIINLPKLETLLLRNNQFSSVPSSIFELQNLSQLDLSGNLITELPNMHINLPKLETLLLHNNRLRYVPSSIFALHNLSVLSLSGNFISELPDMFTNLHKLKFLLLDSNQLQYLPPSILSLHLSQLEIDFNEFNFEIPPSVGSEMNLHSLKELSYRTILNHKLKVKEGMLPVKFLKDLENHHQCVCGCKYVEEGQDLLFLCNLKNFFTNVKYHSIAYSKFPIRGKMCTSFQSCFLDHFTKCQ